MNEQTRIQHTLKLLVECEYDGQEISATSVAEKLSIPAEQLDQLIKNLRAAALVEPDSLALTPSGREYALHVLQAHRLYETYLASKTGLPESVWHKLADEREHDLSKEDVRKLAEELGHPRFDPHGDPIPTAMVRCLSNEVRLWCIIPPAGPDALCISRMNHRTSIPSSPKLALPLIPCSGSTRRTKTQ